MQTMNGNTAELKLVVTDGKLTPVERVALDAGHNTAGTTICTLDGKRTSTSTYGRGLHIVDGKKVMR